MKRKRIFAGIDRFSRGQGRAVCLFGEGAFGHPRLTKTNICRGGGSPPALTQSYSFLSIIRFHTRFFFVSAGAKKKLSKRNAVKEMRKGGFLKKAPFQSPKNFLAAGAGMSGVCTKATNVPAY